MSLEHIHADRYRRQRRFGREVLEALLVMACVVAFGLAVRALVTWQ